jgi:hypothetical protein
MKRSLLATGIALLALAPGCANKFYTAKLDEHLHVPKDDATGKREEVDGLIVYQPKLKRLVYELTALTDAQGNVVATSDGSGEHRCIPSEKIEFKTLPDYAHPYALRHVPSQFASGSLEVHLTDGMVTSVNSESDPQLDETITALAGLIESAASAAAPAATLDVERVGAKLCNDRPVLRGAADV